MSAGGEVVRDVASASFEAGAEVVVEVAVVANLAGLAFLDV